MNTIRQMIIRLASRRRLRIDLGEQVEQETLKLNPNKSCCMGTPLFSLSKVDCKKMCFLLLTFLNIHIPILLINTFFVNFFRVETYKIKKQKYFRTLLSFLVLSTFFNVRYNLYLQAVYRYKYIQIMIFLNKSSNSIYTVNYIYKSSNNNKQYLIYEN